MPQMSHILKQKTIAIIGYGSQGHAQALNLKDSGYTVIVGLRKKSPHKNSAQKSGFNVLTISEATKKSDIIMLLISDMAQPTVYKKEIEPFLKNGQALAFAHGFNIHFKTIQPPKNIDVFLVAPKGPGPLIRTLYKDGKGVPVLYAVHQNPSKQAHQLAKEYAYAIGCLKGALIKTTFREETETDLFSEQTVLCGGITRLIQNSFETLVEAGYKPQIAYFECLHELKFIADLIHQNGLTGMRKAISQTAQWGDYSVGDAIINETTKKAMQKALTDIRSGKFASDWIKEYNSGMKNFHQARKKGESHQIEKVGKKLRKIMEKEIKQKS